MSGKNLSLVFFFVGAFVLHAYQTLSFLWYLVGIPLDYPLVALLRGLGAYTLGLVIGFSPLIGLLLMVVGGLVYGRGAGKEVRRNDTRKRNLLATLMGSGSSVTRREEKCLLLRCLVGAELPDRRRIP